MKILTLKNDDLGRPGSPSRLSIDTAEGSGSINGINGGSINGINYAQQNADDAMMREWLDYEGIAILADAGTMCSVQGLVQCAMCNVQCAMCNVQCAMCNVQC